MSANQPGQYRLANPASQHSRNYSASGQPPPPAGFTYDSYQSPANPPHQQQPGAVPPMKQDYAVDGDVAMEDADPYNRMKYPSRPTHAHRLSAGYVPREDSTAARRYSPMAALPPSSPYTASPQQTNHVPYNAYVPNNASARQSPTRPSAYTTPPNQPFLQSPSTFTTPVWRAGRDS